MWLRLCVGVCGSRTLCAGLLPALLQDQVLQGEVLQRALLQRAVLQGPLLQGPLLRLLRRALVLWRSGGLWMWWCGPRGCGPRPGPGPDSRPAGPAGRWNLI